VEVRVLSSAPPSRKARVIGPFLFCLLIGAWPPAVALAQPDDPHAAQPERPSVATHAFTVAPGWVELELGAARESSHGTWIDTNLPVNVKLGLAPRLQLALSTTPVHAADGGGFTTDALGAALKWRVVDRAPVVGALAVLPTVQVGAFGGRGSPVAAGVVLISSLEARGLAVDLNLGFARQGQDETDGWTSQTLWAVSVSGPLAEAVSWGGELFGFRDGFDDGHHDRVVGALASLTISVRRWLAIDVSGTLPVAGEQPRVVQAGLVWNVGRLWPARSGVSAPMVSRPVPPGGL
jgi:hypothetical protein